ncbi:MAG TPA: DUF4185 domain-containing protein [Gemmatimonadaceae bacterium]|nr:DUF4185 domain-containing protein [Gemmatimonadaceae bacterium]
MLLPIKGAVRRDETTLRLGGFGNDWHMTWAADDSQFVALCDGSGWPGTPNHLYNSRLYRIVGGPADARFEHVPGYPDLIDELPLAITQPRYVGYGTLALDGRIYQFLSTISFDTFSERHVDHVNPRFDGVKLIYSPDGGDTWCNQDGSTPVTWEGWEDRTKDTMLFWEEPQHAFSLVSVLQMGRNYEANEDGYVYVFGPNGVTDGTMNELVMFRVPKERILDRGAYEYFAGHRPDGGADWARDVDGRGVVHTFPRGWVNDNGLSHAWQPSLAFNEALGVYMMVVWGHGRGPNSDEFSSPSYLGMFVARKPWGPWTQIHEETAWTPLGDAAARVYQPQIAPKWIAADGRSFWLVWSDFQTAGGEDWGEGMRRIAASASSQDELLAGMAALRPHFAFNTQRVDLILA